MLYLVPPPAPTTESDDHFSLDGLSPASGNTTDRDSLKEDVFAIQVIDGVQNSPETNPHGPDLGYQETRDFALSLLKQLNPIPTPQEINDFVAEVMIYGSKTPGGARYVQVALAEV